nr:HprK-related kinase A [uncultured Roseateles sp.]
MKVSDISEASLRDLIRHGELLLQISPFVTRIRSDVHKVAREIASMYGDFAVCSPDTFADFHVEVALESGLRRWVNPLARFAFDGKRAFVPLPAEQAFPMIEWGLNWCVAAHAHQYLIIHAAVVEKGGRAAVLPAPPGSGKSTLCAGLVNRGWRLLSDELALYDFATGLIYGMARPVNLKNASIGVIQAFAPDAVFTPPVPDTAKGTVALMRPPTLSVQRATEPAKPAWVVLPKYQANSDALLCSHDKAQAFMLVAEQSFNYDIHGVRGFNAVADLLDQCASYRFSYSNLDDAVRVFDQLAADLNP